ncbi:MAG: 2Fe-2S iron-sulfur cluster-binding protein [Gammaproteobacteria bacterium]
MIIDSFNILDISWPENLHCEYFIVPEEVSTAISGDAEFQVRVASSDQVFTVPQDKSIVQVLREHGFHIDTSCEEGHCGTCMTRYLEGEPEHRDIVLDDDDRRNYVLICCARSRSHELVLDL